MVQVEVEEGFLEGELLESDYGKPYYSFKGIPYAEPPIGDLRFKAPKPVKPWTTVRSAKQFGPICYQRDWFARTPPSGSEDCLYLNVYSPNISPSEPLPVMFWIHGGAFIWGSGDDNFYGPEFIVRHNVILVTFNYRLGALGYLCLNTEDIPGNAGMKDQVLALKWVNKNISKFGGDPSNITIFGESAGGGCVGFHLLSPMSRGLFKRAIMQSGSFASFWAIIWCPREKAIALARKLGLNSEDDKELYEFLKLQPMESLIDLNLQVTQARKPYGTLHFGIVSEKDFGDNERFFYGDLYDWMQTGIHEDVEVLLGYTEHEGLMGLSDLFLNDIEQLSNIANDFVEFFIPQRMANEIPLIKHLELGRKIKKFYFEDRLVSEDGMDDLLNYMNMELFSFDIITSANFLTGKNKTYLYKFTCKSKRNQMKDIFGATEFFIDRITVSHADDVAYLFPVKLLNQKIVMKSETFKIINNVTKLWTNFAKHGNPTPDDTLGVKWAPYTIQDQDYLDIGNKFVAKTFPDKQDVMFWEDLYHEYLSRCVAY